MSVSHELAQTAIIMNPQSLFVTAGSGIALATTAVKAFTMVNSSEMAVRVRKGVPVLKEGLTPEQIEAGGDIYQTLAPGFHWLRPFVDNIVKVSTADNINALEEFPIHGSDDHAKHSINADLIWYVRADSDNPVKALFNVNNEKDNKDKEKMTQLTKAVLTICGADLGLVLRKKTSNELVNLNLKQINKKLIKQSEEELLRYGVALRGIKLKPGTECPETVIAKAIVRANSPPTVDVIAVAASAGQDGRGQIIPFPRDTE